LPSEEIKAVKFTCGGCGATAIVEEGARPEGYHGRIELATIKGETGGEVYACRKACIRAAVLNATGGSNTDLPEPAESDEPDYVPGPTR
jgi:hypothetical protein